LTIRNATVIFEPEEAVYSKRRGHKDNPFQIGVDSGGSLFIYNSKIIGPEWGPLGGIQVVAYRDSNLIIRDSEIRNAGFWCGSGAVAMEDGASGAIIENNTFISTYSAVSVEHSYDTRVIDNTISNSVMGINVIMSENITIAGNKISKTAWLGIGIGGSQTPVNNNEISNAWGVGIFPNHWGIMPEDNSFFNIKGPSVLFQHPNILTGPSRFRAFSLDSTSVEAGQKITVFVRLAHAKPFYGWSSDPDVPQTIYEVLSIPFSVRLRVNGEIIDSEPVTLDLGESTIVELAGTAEEAGIYDVMVQPADLAMEVPVGLYLGIGAGVVVMIIICGVLFRKRLKH